MIIIQKPNELAGPQDPKTLTCSSTQWTFLCIRSCANLDKLTSTNNYPPTAIVFFFLTFTIYKTPHTIASASNFIFLTMMHATMATSTSTSLQNDMNTLIAESSCLKLQPTSPQESDNIKKTTTTPPPPSQSSCSSDLAASSLSFPSLKYEPLDQGDMEIQSPDTNSLWESFFSEQLDADFMISSPVRTSYYPNNGHPPFGCSPPRMASPLAPFNNNNNKAKGMSPLQRVFSNCNSPNNQFMEVETISLPAIENFLDDFDGGDDFLTYSGSTSVAGVSSSDQSYDPLATIPALLDCLTLPSPSRFYDEANGTVRGGGVGGSSDNDQMYHQIRPAPSNAPLMEQLEQERREEKQSRRQQQHHHQPRQQMPSRLQPPQPQPQSQPMSHNHLMVPPPVGPEVVFLSIYVLLVCA